MLWSNIKKSLYLLAQSAITFLLARQSAPELALASVSDKALDLLPHHHLHDSPLIRDCEKIFLKLGLFYFFETNFITAGLFLTPNIKNIISDIISALSTKRSTEQRVVPERLHAIEELLKKSNIPTPSIEMYTPNSNAYPRAFASYLKNHLYFNLSEDITLQEFSALAAHEITHLDRSFWDFFFFKTMNESFYAVNASLPIALFLCAQEALPLLLNQLQTSEVDALKDLDLFNQLLGSLFNSIQGSNDDPLNDLLIKIYHSLLNAPLNSMIPFNSLAVCIFAQFFSTFFHNQIQREEEIRADRGAVRLISSGEPLIKALEKLEGKIQEIIKDHGDLISLYYTRQDDNPFLRFLSRFFDEHPTLSERRALIQEEVALLPNTLEDFQQVIADQFLQCDDESKGKEEELMDKDVIIEDVIGSPSFTGNMYRGNGKRKRDPETEIEAGPRRSARIAEKRRKRDDVSSLSCYRP